MNLPCCNEIHMDILVVRWDVGCFRSIRIITVVQLTWPSELQALLNSPMRVLLDTNIIIHREAFKVSHISIG